MNLPNKLTMLRILLVPVFMVLAANRWMLAAGIVFAAASFTDFLDGYLARKNHLVTDFGKFADPLADKLLTTTAFVYMIVDGKVIAANMWGKVKTVLQMLTIIFYYFGFAIEAAVRGDSFAGSVFTTQVISYGLCWVVAAVTLISGVKYLWDNRAFINTAK